MRFRQRQFRVAIALLTLFALVQAITHPTELRSALAYPFQKQNIIDLQRKYGGTHDARGFEQAVVQRVLDGDTIELADDRIIRYVGVDTPELHHPNKGKECYGQEAYERNRDLVEGKVIQLERDHSEVDKYGRTLRFIWVGSRLINQILIEEGLGFARTYKPDVTREEQFVAAELKAFQAHRGLWQHCTIENDRTQQIRKPP